ncbi:MAG: hypothetical protein OXG44_12025, partial [Gammaproteobacteria bacterium]|nr:hypothetical protein [Gammaproteobacteria bacterium]
MFDHEMSSHTIKEFLTRAGFVGDRYASLEAASPEDMDTLAEWIDDLGGLAIAAHVDSKNGLMTFRVGDERHRVASSRSIRAFEITDPSKRVLYQYEGHTDIDRNIPCIMNSDCRSTSASGHHLDCIGDSFTNLKMESVSVYGIKQSLYDPRLRVKLPNDPIVEPTSMIHGMYVNGGFLDG